MYTLLVVDDEPNIVEGLSSQFEQRYADSVIVLKSYSGEHALSVIRNNKVDVILSDVRMPDVDGLELICETEKLWPQARFVFLSGLDEFDYIHQASKSSIYRGYLLKMEGDEVVMEKVDSMIEQCAADQRAEDERGRMHAFVQRAALESARGRVLAGFHRPDHLVFPCHRHRAPGVSCAGQVSFRVRRRRAESHRTRRHYACQPGTRPCV